MGRASRLKATRRQERRQRPDLLTRLHEHTQFLEASADAYDRGFHAEAKRIAVTLRVLLHDTNTSASLLQQLGEKERLLFVDTALPIHLNNLIPSNSGLVVMRYDSRLGGQYVPPLGDLMPGHIHPPIPFKPWWMTAVLRDTKSDGWSRRRLVDALANQEGGAHVDPNLNESYLRITGDESLGWTYNTESHVNQPFRGDVAAASMRQIAYEMLETLRNADIK